MITLQIGMRQVFIDDEDYDRVIIKPWYITQNGYVAYKNSEDNNLLHRYILNYTGPLFVDHIDRDPCNNCKNNLRIVEIWVNNLNSKMNSLNTSGHKGVRQTATGKWEAYININDRKRHLGVFDTVEQAIEERKNFEASILEDPSRRNDQFPELRRSNKSGVTGVSYNTRTDRWKAKINQTHLGYFRTKEEAIIARKAAELKIGTL